MFSDQIFDLMAIFLANFFFVAFKAFQQRNVTWMKYSPVFPTSLSLAITQVYIWRVVALRTNEGDSFLQMWPIILALALAGWLGCVSAMYLHDRYIK